MTEAYPDWIDRSEYPFTANFTDVGPGRMHYVDVGPETPDDTVLLLHGNPTWSFAYRNVIRRLAPRFRCVAPDFIGFGLSDKPPDWTYRPRDHAQCLRTLIDALGLEGITLVAHDWGGPIGISLAIERPSIFARMVISNSWLWPPTDIRTRLFARVGGSAPARLAVRRLNALVYLMPIAFSDSTRLTAAAKHHYIHAQRGPRTASAQLPAEFLASADWLQRLWDRRDVLKSIPKSLVWGLRDPVIRPKHLDRWLRAYPNATVLGLEDVGHFVPEEAPQHIAMAAERLIASR